MDQIPGDYSVYTSVGALAAEVTLGGGFGFLSAGLRPKPTSFNSFNLRHHSALLEKATTRRTLSGRRYISRVSFFIPLQATPFQSAWASCAGSLMPSRPKRSISFPPLSPAEYRPSGSPSGRTSASGSPMCAITIRERARKMLSRYSSRSRPSRRHAKR